MRKEEEKSVVTRLLNRFDYSIFKQPPISNKQNVRITLFLNGEEIRLMRKILRNYKMTLED